MTKHRYINLNTVLTNFILVGCLLCFSAKAQELDTLKVRAAEHNLDLKAQYKVFEAQLEGVTQAKAWQDPNLSFGYFISPIETRVGPQIARFSLTQMLPWFGTFKARGDVAAYRAEAAFEKFQDQKFKLFLEVAEKYYDLTALKFIAELEAEQLQVLEDLKSIVESNYENNKANLVDILRFDLEIEDIKSSIQVLKKQDQAIVSQLNQLMNRPLKTPIEILDAQKILAYAENLEADIIAKDHPRLEIIRNLQESNQAESELAKKQAMPQFGLGFDYAIIQDRNVMNADAGQDAFMPMLSVSLPIFGNKNKSRKKQTQLEGESLQFQFENEETRLATEIQVAHYQKEELLSLLDLYNKQLESLKDILQLSEVALANASMDIEEVLRLEEERLLYEKQKANTLAKIKKTDQTLNYLTLNSEL